MSVLHRTLHRIEDLAAFLSELAGTWEANDLGYGTYTENGHAIRVHWSMSAGLVRFYTPVSEDLDPERVPGLTADAMAINTRLNLGQFLVDTQRRSLGFGTAAVLANDGTLGSDVCATHIVTALQTVKAHREALTMPSRPPTPESSSPPWWSAEE